MAMPSDAHVGRKLIALTPVLLVAGIVAQVFLLIAVVVMFVPLLIWPGMLNKPYRIVTRAMGRLMARSIIGKKPKPKAGMVPVELSFRYTTRRPLVPPGSACHFVIP
jgi:hypothetical protein